MAMRLADRASDGCATSISSRVRYWAGKPCQVAVLAHFERRVCRALLAETSITVSKLYTYRGLLFSSSYSHQQPTLPSAKHSVYLYLLHGVLVLVL